jgi:hypothetical protein
VNSLNMLRAGVVICTFGVGIWLAVRLGSLEKKCERGDSTACGVLGDRTYHAAASSWHASTTGVMPGASPVPGEGM